MSTLEETRLQAEIDKIRTETRKLEAEIHALRKPVLFKPTAWIPVLAGIAALGGSVTQWIKTAEELKTARQQEKQLVSYTEGLRNQQEQQARETKAELENRLPSAVEIQLAGQLVEFQANNVDSSIEFSPVFANFVFRFFGFHANHFVGSYKNRG